MKHVDQQNIYDQHCKFRDYTCNYCKKNGHLEKVCRQKKNEQLSTKHITTVSKLNSSNSSTSTTQSLDSSCMISLEVNGTSNYIRN